MASLGVVQRHQQAERSGGVLASRLSCCCLPLRPELGSMQVCLERRHQH